MVKKAFLLYEMSRQYSTQLVSETFVAANTFASLTIFTISHMHRIISLTRISNSRLSTSYRLYNRSTIHDLTKNPITNEGATKILKEMVRHLWPRDIPSHKYRVVGLNFVR